MSYMKGLDPRPLPILVSYMKGLIPRPLPILVSYMKGLDPRPLPVCREDLGMRLVVHVHSERVLTK